ncbi:hypothetical protein F4556_003706 [Kitasatospora gansuensis]|uniref:Uncharacterized protein n=1 Tax=Kitasatospora gansuensis TaxID=258050 RepID=A0A7W7SCY3_9ACTN|nr:hypothetical protein [Kitasatospora gansuensis]MBB4948171.1 hypothetical protein [Kitasatospora gansuensis]
MVDFNALVRLDVGSVDRFIGEWQAIMTRLVETRTGFEGQVTAPLAAGGWTGKDAEAAVQHCRRVGGSLEAVSKEVEGLVSFTRKMTDGGEEGLQGLRELNRRAKELERRAGSHGLAVAADGTVSSTVSRPSDPNPSAETVRAEAERAQYAAQLQQAAQELLEKARKADEWLALSLKVVIGTEDNFETENRAFDQSAPDLSDYTTEGKLKAVELALQYKMGLPDAADLLNHWLGASGKPYQVDPARMMQDMPSTFGNDVKLRLAELHKQHDGSFSTPWKPSAPDTDKDKGGLNWYYALNHFQYRLVGEKHHGTITYRVEVQKRYNWGTPSEHRRDLDKTPLIHLEQADIAHLHSTGLAQDFDVKGTTGPLTSPG